MRTVVGVANLDEVVSRSLARARRRAEGETVRPERHILFEHAEDMVTLMTPHRIRLYSEVKERALSVTDLARALDRDRSAVSRNVKALQELRLIKLTRSPCQLLCLWVTMIRRIREAAT